MKRRIVTARLGCITVLLIAFFVCPSYAAPPQPVTLAENNRSFFLDNGILNVTVAKRTGAITFINYPET